MSHPVILIETIPAESMRYKPTLGDWFVDGRGVLHIQVSDAVPEAERILIALHELVEVTLCEQRGISQEAVDQFDFAFKGDGEPGDDPEAPYRHQHRFAMLVEHLMAREMGISGYGEVT